MGIDASQIEEYGRALEAAGEERIKEEVLKPLGEYVANHWTQAATEGYMQETGATFGGRNWRDRSDTGPLRIVTGDLASAVRGDLSARGSFVRSIEIVEGRMQFLHKLLLPYARIHEEGGRIPVTEKMRGFFWAMHLQAAEGSEDAERWKALALGAEANSHFTIPARPYAEPALEDTEGPAAERGTRLVIDLLDRL